MFLMASRGRTGSPQTEPFPPLDPAPHTPTSISSISAVTNPIGSENPNLLRPHSAYPYPIASRTSLSPKSVRGLSPRLSPRPLTGAAAMVDIRRHKQHQQQEQQQQQQQNHHHNQQQQQQPQQEGKTDSRHTSPNLAISALNSLMNNPGMSKATDTPTKTNNLSEPMRKAADHLSVPIIHTGESSQPSPVSISSFGGNENPGPTKAMTATTNGSASSSDRPQHMVAEPADLNDDPTDYLDAGRAYTAPSSANTGPKAFSYPGPMSADSRELGPRGSPANAKRHKCPYCSTDFTRHHNLKSHLLTHSQEKPYVCQTCSARFRRLHDLKRHTKLHTGERPHTCDKCGRKFARGDALARHNKGPGGCAGRRSSFGADDDANDSRAGDDSMDVDYQDHDEDDPEGEDSGDTGRRLSEPSRKRAHLESAHDAARSVYREHSSTYPGIAGRPLRSTMGPPSNVPPSSSTVTSPGELSNQVSPGRGGVSSQYYPPPPGLVLGQGGMTESPKPISPRQLDQHRLSIAEATNMRNRSPSLTQQFHQHHYGRGTGQSTPPMPGHVPSQHPPQLPSLPGLNSDTVRLGHQTRLPIAPPGPSMLQHQIPPGPTSASNPGSLSSHGRSSGGSIRDIVGSSEQDIWNYVRSLEQRFSRMQDEYELRMSRMQEELISLRQHVNIHPHSR